MKSGRCLYTELPKSFTLIDNRDSTSSRPYLSFNLTKEEPVTKEVEYWLTRKDENCEEYFYNEVQRLYTTTVCDQKF